MTKVFIDGQAGTTGLQIFDMLRNRSDLEIITIPEDQRKIPAARKELLNSSEITIFCLPDDAATEASSFRESDTRIIDASTAHRVDDQWVYGLPELSENHRQKIRNAALVSNPGCYPQGFILLVKPLIDEGIIEKQAALSCNAVSGYSGGGRQMIEEFTTADAQGQERLSVNDYSLTLSHKHVPEMRKHSGLTTNPLFLPTVANYYKGMIVRVPLHLETLTEGKADNIVECLKDQYKECQFIRVHDYNDTDLLENVRLNPVACNDTNFMDLMCFGNSSQLVLLARYDNLGKGAAGAAVQNLNIMLGVEEEKGL